MQDVQFLCPTCGHHLDPRENGFSCANSHQYSLQNGVIKLSSQPSYWSLLPENDMQLLLSDAAAKGWKRAILESASQRVKDLYLWTDCPARADGAFYLNLDKNSSVLDLGAGWGTYTFALAPRVKEVVAADTNVQSLEWISLRARQENRANISTVHINPLDFGQIPTADRQFDAVILNGVLEWVGSYLKHGDPKTMQQNCLKEIFRVLKPGGQLWIGIENRFGLRYFQGAGDDHLTYYSKDKIAYTTIFPRWLADITTMRKLGQLYRTYTHSLWGHQRMLARAGFQRTDYFYPVSDYRAASTKVIPVESSECAELIDGRLGAFWKTIVKTFRLEAALCDSYFIRAGKGE
jgi:ubiquinone/menaquinone biosynthesis C-methylase UbiE